MVLVSILKSPSSARAMSSQPQVRFDLPLDKESIVDYLRQQNDDTSYAAKRHAVVKAISSSDMQDDVLLRWIIEFKDNVLILSKENEAIMFALLHVSWYQKSAEFIRVYHELVINVVTAHAWCLRPVLSQIVHLLYRAEDLNSENLEELVNMQNVHRLLKHMVQLIPMCKDQVCSMFSDCFPYVLNAPAMKLLRCIQNLLTACSYLPSKRITILETIFSKLIQLDVMCTKDNIEDYEIQKEEENMEEDSSTKPTPVDPFEMAMPLANTFDMLIDCIFKYIHVTCFPEGSLNWDATKKLYKELLTIFDKIILPTQGISHVQYVIFYMCSINQELCDGFLDYLWKKVQNPAVGPVFRQISAFYMGSMLSRARYITISTVVACFDLICDWIHRYIDAHTSEDHSVHGTFHSVCQTVFYVFAFRSKELLEMDGGFKYIQSLNFDRMVTCRLNPLRFCDKTIVQNFASITRNHQIAYVYPVIEKNNRNLLYSQQSKYQSGDMIATFFPYDPYLLKRSKHWIESQYRVYNHSQKEVDAMDYEEEEPSISEDLFSYGSSPGFKKTLLLRHKI